MMIPNELLTSPRQLTFQLIPVSTRSANLRCALPAEAWDNLRREVYAAYHHRCAICGANAARLECHEVWAFDDTAHVQALSGLQALCRLCHRTTHITIGAHAFNDDENAAACAALSRHFVTVNGCTQTAFLATLQDAFETWRARSLQPWRIDLGPLSPYVDLAGQARLALHCLTLFSRKALAKQLGVKPAWVSSWLAPSFPISIRPECYQPLCDTLTRIASGSLSLPRAGGSSRNKPEREIEQMQDFLECYFPSMELSR